MFKIIYCFIFGHKKYQPQVLYKRDFICLNDSLGSPLVSINVCERCKRVYAEFKG